MSTTIHFAWDPHSITIRAYCKCGDALHTTMNPPTKLEFVLETFAAAHQDEGCGPCDAKTARKARRKREKAGMERLV